MKCIWAIASLAVIYSLLVGCDSSSSVENPDSSYFIKFYGQDGDQTGQDLVLLPDGSMVLFGTTRPTVPTHGTQWYVVRVDPNGSVMWEKEFGGLNDEEASDIELTSNNLLALVGNYYKTPSDRDVLVMTLTLDGIKVDSSLQATRSGGGAVTTGDENAVSITEVLGGGLTPSGFLISGSTSYVGLSGKPASTLADVRDALKIRVNSDLSVYPNSWVQTYGYVADDASQKIIEADTGLYYVFGYTNSLPPGQSVPNFNFWVYSLGADGDFIDEDIYPGIASTNEKLSSFSRAPIQAPFEGFFLGGFSQSAVAPSDFYVAKLRESLTFGTPPTNPPVSDIVFEKPLSVNLGNNLQEETAIVATMDGGLLVMGIENGFDNNQNWVLTRVKFDGSLAWSIPIVFGGEGMDTCGGIQELPDGRIVVVGTMRTGRPDAGEFKLTLVKVSATGKFAE